MATGKVPMSERKDIGVVGVVSVVPEELLVAYCR